jgi:large subunit ribosomal protein L7/L12
MATKDKLEALRKREAEIKARIAEAEAKEKAQSRKEDTRVKVLVGAAFLADIDKNPETRALVLSVVERAIVNPKDREFLKSKGWL